MSERKVLNKYYPPDFDPSKIPRMKLAKNRQYTVRLMAPFNMRCATCGEYIYKGKKFNARKEDVENETYLGIRIYRFYIKCTRCLQEISFKTDPQNTDYEIEAGATRNFMALKLAEEQAKREQDELREEEANNPMKLLEKRTEQSKNEIDLLESLEELRDQSNRRQNIDYNAMLQTFDKTESTRERLERQEREDEEFIKSVNFKNKTTKLTGKRVIVEEVIEEMVKNEFKPPFPKKSLTTTETEKVDTVTASPNTVNLYCNKTTSNSFSYNKNPLRRVLIKKKQPTTEVNSQSIKKIFIEPESLKTSISTSEKNGKGGLSLLSTYSDSDDSEE